jgi:hypothetical protein
MTEEPLRTPAGQQAAADKAAAADKIRADAAADQADAEAKRQQTAAARNAAAAKRAARQAAATPNGQWAAAVDEEPAGPQPCDSCREHQEMVMARLGVLEVRVQAVAKLVLSAAVAGAVIYFMSGRQTAAEIES